jgi:hypothetical protein
MHPKLSTPTMKRGNLDGVEWQHKSKAIVQIEKRLHKSCWQHKSKAVTQVESTSVRAATALHRTRVLECKPAPQGWPRAKARVFIG